MPFYFVKHYTARERIFYSYFSLLSQTISAFVWTLGLSLLLFLACEAPTRGLEALVFKPKRRSREDQGDADNCKKTNGVPRSKAEAWQTPKLPWNSKENGSNKPRRDDDSCCHL
ncbi:unnamed protein product [Ixodes hexagonus]